MEKKKKLIILGVILLLIIVSGATFAILTWNSTMIKLGINTNCFTIDYTRGGDITGSLKLINWGDIYSDEDNTFTIKKGMGLSYVNVGINSNCSIEGYGTIYLNVTELSDTFKDGGESFGALGYAVLKNTSDLSNSDITIDNLDSQSFEVLNIQPIMETGKIELYSEQLSNTEVNKYLVVIFVDKLSAGNDITEAIFKGNISVEAEQKRYGSPDYCFTLSDKDDVNKTASIDGYNCYEGNSYGYEIMTDLVIPSVIDGYSIIKINKLAFCTEYNYFDSVCNKGANLTSVIIPNSVIEINGDGAGNAFSDNLTLTGIIVDKNNPVYDSRDNSNAIIETSTNTLIQGCKNTIIPSSVTIIGDYAFYNTGLTSITIPESVTTIGVNAFNRNELANITIPDSVTTIGAAAFSRNQLTSVTIPDSITILESSVFIANKLVSVTIPDSVTTIKSRAFYENYLLNVEIPDSVITIERDAFTYNNLNYVYIGNNSKLTSIGYRAFYSSNETYTSGWPVRTYVNNPNLKVIYNNSGRAFNWNEIVNGNSGTSFVTGTTTSRTSGSTTYNAVEIKTGTP